MNTYIYQINAKPGEEDLFTRKVVCKVTDFIPKKSKLTGTIDIDKVSMWDKVDLSKPFGYEVSYKPEHIKMVYFKIDSLELTHLPTSVDILVSVSPIKSST